MGIDQANEAFGLVQSSCMAEAMRFALAGNLASLSVDSLKARFTFLDGTEFEIWTDGTVQLVMKPREESF